MIVPKSNIFKSHVDIASLALFRFLFGIVMVWEIMQFIKNGWDRFYTIPEIHFAYYLFDWIKPPPDNVLTLLLILLVISAFCIAIGFLYRLFSITFFLGFAWLFYMDQSFYQNHFYFILLLSFLFMFLPMGKYWSLDSLFKVVKKKSRIPAIFLWILIFQFGVVYFYGGIAKLFATDWLDGEPIRMWLSVKKDFPVIGHFVTNDWMVMIFVWTGLLLDLFIVPLLLWKKTRRMAFLAGLFFAVMNANLFHIGTFPYIMLAGMVLFFDPAWPRNLWLKINSKKVKRIKYTTSTNPKYPLLWIAGIALYVSFQLLFPLRHFFIEGNADWTYEGHMFSWRMKLNDKQADEVYFFAHDKSGQTHHLRLENYIILEQYRKLKLRPDMMIQMADFLEEKILESGMENFSITATTNVSWNGRPARPLLDPNTNLLNQKKSLLRHLPMLTE